MNVMKDYGLTDYKGGKTYEDFLEPGEKVLFISDVVSHVVAVYGGGGIRNQRSGLEDPMIVTNLRLFIMQKERKVFFVTDPAQIVDEILYDYDYAKKVIEYAKGVIQRVNAAGLNKGKVIAEESQHRTKTDGMTLLMGVKPEKSFFGAESLRFMEMGISLKGKQGVLGSLLGPSGKVIKYPYPFDIKKPLVAVSPEAKKYPTDPKYPNTGQCVAYLNEKINEISKKVEDIKALAQQLENL